ncbi:TetR/AcrR family transcriptional regulator [Vibrio sp. RC27]
MPKRSKEDTEQTIRIIKEAVVEQMLELGYDKMSYTTLSEYTGISRTGISHHFPRKTDFTDAIDGTLFKIFVEHLVFDGGIETFKQSWTEALSSYRFVAILRLFIHHIVIADGSLNFSKKGLDSLYEISVEKLGSEAEHTLDCLLGKSLVKMSR